MLRWVLLLFLLYPCIWFFGFVKLTSRGVGPPIYWRGFIDNWNCDYSLFLGTLELSGRLIFCPICFEYFSWGLIIILFDDVWCFRANASLGLRRTTVLEMWTPFFPPLSDLWLWLPLDEPTPRLFEVAECSADLEIESEVKWGLCLLRELLWPPISAKVPPFRPPLNFSWIKSSDSEVGLCPVGGPASW